MKNFSTLVVFCVLLYSCGTQKKMTETRKVLAEVKQQQETESSKISGISGYSINKVAEGKIDSNVSNRITALLKKYKNEVEANRSNVATIDTLLLSKREFKTQYKTFIVPLLDALQKKNGDYTNRLSAYAMIEEGLNIANYKLFDLAAFFGPGVYTIPDDKAQLTRASFSPIIDSVIVFAKKYGNRPLTASLIVLGFADGTGISNESSLYDTLINISGNKEMSKEELNIKLSELRALELTKQISSIVLEKGPLINSKNLKIEYIYQGKGEKYPFMHIKDYAIDDPRRRIVLCYWVVLPD